MRSRNLFWILLALVGIVVLILFLVRDERNSGDRSPSGINPVESKDSSSAAGDAPNSSSAVSSWTVRNKYGDVPDPRPENVKPRQQGYHNRFQIDFRSPVPKSVLTLKLQRDDILTFQFFTEGETNGNKGFNYFEVSDPKNGIYTLDLFTAGEIKDVKTVFELRVR